MGQSSFSEARDHGTIEFLRSPGPLDNRVFPRPGTIGQSSLSEARDHWTIEFFARPKSQPHFDAALQVRESPAQV